MREMDSRRPDPAIIAAFLRRSVPRNWCSLGLEEVLGTPQRGWRDGDGLGLGASMARDRRARACRYRLFLFARSPGPTSLARSPGPTGAPAARGADPRGATVAAAPHAVDTF